MKYAKSDQLKVKSKSKNPKNERKELIKQLDQVIRDILKKQPEICVCCKQYKDNLQVGHYVTRRVYALRWDLRNVARQCGGCNIRHNYDPIPYTRYILDMYGKQVLDDLTFTRNSINKVTVSMMRDMLVELKEKL